MTAALARLVAAVALVAAAVPASALADPAAVAPADLQAAKTHFDSGVALFKTADFGSALAEFQASYQLNPLPGVLYNIALCEKGMYRYTEAVADLTEYLSHRAELPAARVAEAQKVLAELVAVLADVTVTITPIAAWDGSTVLIDGRAVPAATLVHPVKLAGGKHTIDVSRDGYRPVQRELLVEPTVAQTVAIALEAVPTTARVHVTASSARATVAVDSVTKGLAPLDVELTGGTHHVEVTATGYVAHAEEIVVTPGVDRGFDVVLVKAPSSRPWYARPAFWIPAAAVLVGGTIGIIAATSKPSPIDGTLAPGVSGVP